MLGLYQETKEDASRSRIIAAAVAEWSPNLLSQNLFEIEPLHHSKRTNLKAVATISIYQGKGLEIPKLWINNFDKKGSEFAWYVYSSILSSVLGITRYARLWEDDETIMTTRFSLNKNVPNSVLNESNILEYEELDDRLSLNSDSYDDVQTGSNLSLHETKSNTHSENIEPKSKAHMTQAIEHAKSLRGRLSNMQYLKVHKKTDCKLALKLRFEV